MPTFITMIRNAPKVIISKNATLKTGLAESVSAKGVNDKRGVVIRVLVFLLVLLSGS